MKSVKLPFQLATSNTRCDAMLFTLVEIQTYWNVEVRPLLASGSKPEDINKKFMGFIESTLDAVGGIRPAIEFPEMNMEGLNIEIPVSRIIHMSPSELQNQINQAAGRVGICNQDQPGSTANAKKPE